MNLTLHQTVEVLVRITGTWVPGDEGVPVSLAGPGEPSDAARFEVEDVEYVTDLADWLARHEAEVQDLARREVEGR